MAQKRVLRLVRFPEPPAQPVETRAERANLARPADRDRLVVTVLAEAGDGAPEVAKRPRNPDGEQRREPDRHGQERADLPQQLPPGARCGAVQRLELVIDERVAGPRDHRRQLAQERKAFDHLRRGIRRAGARRRLVVEPDCDQIELRERPGQAALGVEGTQRRERVRERDTVLEVQAPQRRVADDEVLPRVPFHVRHVLVEPLRGTRHTDTLADEPLAALGEIVDGESGLHDRERQRQCDERETNEYQARYGSGSVETHHP